MMTVLAQQQPRFFGMASQSSVVATNTEASHAMIEAMLYEMIPSLDKAMAKRLSRQFATLLARVQSREKGNPTASTEECLKFRLKRLSRKLLDVAERRKSSQSSSSSAKATAPQQASIEPEQRPFDAVRAKADRHHILMNAVGEAKYDEIVSIAEEIKQIRGTAALWTKFSQHRHDPTEEERLPASQALPAPIADLYFRTRLVDAMRLVDAKVCASSPDEPVSPCECAVRSMDWAKLLEDARAHLAAYRQFERENVKEGEEPTFRCVNGRCFMR